MKKAGLILKAALLFVFAAAAIFAVTAAAKTPSDLSVARAELSFVKAGLTASGKTVYDPFVNYYNAKGEELNGVVTKKAVFYYDGAETEESRVYLAAGDTLSAYCTVDGVKSNSVDLKGAFVSSMPFIVITPLSQGDPFAAELKIYDNGGLNSMDDVPTVLYASLSNRGKWSATFPKPQYNVKLTDKSGDEAKYGLLGMTAGTDFVFNNPYADKSLVRNYLAYRLGEQMLDASLESRLCEVFIDRNGDGELSDKEYFGVYLVCEKINRKNVGVLKNGGFIVARDKVVDGDKYFTLPSSVYLAMHGTGYAFAHRVKYPTESSITDEEFDYIRDFITELDARIKSGDITESGYAEMLDVDSYIDCVLINEVLKNADGFSFSTYFYMRNRSEKLYSGPVWDFDLSCGNLVRGDGSLANPEGFYTLKTEWTVYLMKDPAFTSRLKERYNMWRKGPLSTENILGIVNGAVEKLKSSGAADRQFDRFPELMNGSFNKNVYSFFVDTRSYGEEMNVMTDFLEKRLEWLDTAINGL